MEFINVILVRQKLKIRFIKDTKSTGLYVLHIYCGNCGGACVLENDNKCALTYDTIIANSTDHLGSEDKANDLFHF